MKRSFLLATSKDSVRKLGLLVRTSLSKTDLLEHGSVRCSKL